MTRRMKQPVKDELRRQLALADAQAAYWKGMFEDAVALPAVRAAVLIALLVGFLLGWVTA